MAKKKDTKPVNETQAAPPEPKAQTKEIKMSEVTVAGVTTSEEEIAKALDLLRRTKEQRTKQAQKNKDNPELAAKAKVRATRLRAKDTLLKQKAIAAGIVVTDEEIDAVIAAGTPAE